MSTSDAEKIQRLSDMLVDNIVALDDVEMLAEALCDAWFKGREKATLEERARIVAQLREWAQGPAWARMDDSFPEHGEAIAAISKSTLEAAADSLEAGE